MYRIYNTTYRAIILITLNWRAAPECTISRNPRAHAPNLPTKDTLYRPFPSLTLSPVSLPRHPCHRCLYGDYARSIARGMSVLNHTSTSSRGRCSTCAPAMRWPSLRMSQARRRAAAGKR